MLRDAPSRAPGNAGRRLLRPRSNHFIRPISRRRSRRKKTLPPPHTHTHRTEHSLPWCGEQLCVCVSVCGKSVKLMPQKLPLNLKLIKNKIYWKTFRVLPRPKQVGGDTGYSSESTKHFLGPDLCGRWLPTNIVLIVIFHILLGGLGGKSGAGVGLTSEAI